MENDEEKVVFDSAEVVHGNGATSAQDKALLNISTSPNRSEIGIYCRYLRADENWMS
jgi:hypothetical protein